MPAGKGGGTGDSGGETSEKNGVNRTSFRPPWVKEGPNPLPVPTMPWTLNKRSSLKDAGDDSSKLVVPQLRKVQKPEPQENGAPKKDTFVKPQLRPVPPKEPTKLQSKEVKVPIKLNSVKDRELPPAVKRDSLKDENLESMDKAMPATRNALVRQESMKRLSIPNAPPMPPPAPAMPKLIETENLSDKQKERLVMLRSRPKTRPDWTQMLKEVESGRKLKHVECNDRSSPLLPAAKAKGQFLYESEKQNAHNELLKAIQQGLRLKKVKTNDRSKPMLEGLRKFRRQMTIEEQIQKSQSMASIPPEEIVADEADEMDDIDKVRDDLQSTKQLLAFELRNKEAQVRENKRLLARIQNLEAELEKASTTENKPQQAAASSEADEKIMKTLKSEAEEARKTSEELEKKYTHAAEELDSKKAELDEAKKQNRELEKKLQEVLQGKRQSICSDRKMSTANNQESEEEEELEMSESDSDESDNEEKRERRAQREIKLFRNKLRTFKNKEDNAKKERLALKEQMKKHQQAIKEEKKKYKALQKEVDKMASLMKDSSEDEEEEEEEEEEEKEESESETESSESETESSGSETESEKSQSEAEDAPLDKVKTNLSQRSKRHENMLAALKKGNYLLKTNVERLQDDLNKQKELTMALQEDLDSVLAELG